VRFLLPYNRPAERHKRQFHQLHVLTGKGNADDRDEKDQSEYEVYEGSVQSTAEQPYDIGKQGKAAGAAVFGNYFLTERPQHNASELKTLESPGYTYNGDA
jgi:hypothetical protein